jgi:hypothetical protein
VGFSNLLLHFRYEFIPFRIVILDHYREKPEINVSLEEMVHGVTVMNLKCFKALWLAKCNA